MAVLPLVIAPDPRLAMASSRVEVFDDRLRGTLRDMLDTMYANEGIGLAAVQVGIHQRIVVVDVGIRDGKPAPQVFINPEIIKHSNSNSRYNEGCLSFPDQFSEVERPADITVRYQNAEGVEQNIHASGILATCLQHEIDHTNGVVFVDHISSLKRDMILRKLKKAKRLGMVSPLPETKTEVQ